MYNFFILYYQAVLAIVMVVRWPDNVILTNAGLDMFIMKRQRPVQVKMDYFGLFFHLF